MSYSVPSKKAIQKFQDTVLGFHAEHGRHTLPWRRTKDPYKILVSEIMLQQTQVERVIEYYQRFLKEFPTVHELSRAPLAHVLVRWQGLGYNRRAKMLHEAAKKVVEEYGGVFPKTAALLESLPGVGPYTARAVAAFSYNEDGWCIETNIRTVLFHHFYKDQEQVSDKELLVLLEKVSPRAQARVWYAALMDYGTHLKKQGIRTNQKSVHYSKQKAFKGSGREVRGAILRALSTTGPQSKKSLLGLFPKERNEEVEALIEKLQSEGMIVRVRNRYALPD